MKDTIESNTVLDMLNTSIQRVDEIILEMSNLKKRLEYYRGGLVEGDYL